MSTLFKLTIALQLLISLSVFGRDICAPDPAPNGRYYGDRSFYRQIKLATDSSIYNERGFKFYEGNGPYATYFTLDLPLAPVRKILKGIKSKYPNLKSRGEAHITVLSPVEYHCVFKPAGVLMGDIERVVREMNLGNISYQVKSLGSGQVGSGKGMQETFFVIVKSRKLIEVRKRVARLLKGKYRANFDANSFYPHITVGFTGRDLHSSQGVYKNERYSKDGRFRVVVNN